MCMCVCLGPFWRRAYVTFSEDLSVCRVASEKVLWKERLSYIDKSKWGAEISNSRIVKAQGLFPKFVGLTFWRLMSTIVVLPHR